MHFLETFKIAIQACLHHFKLLNKLLCIFPLEFHFLRHIAIAEYEIVIGVKSTKWCNRIVNNKFIKSLQENCAKVLV